MMKRYLIPTIATLIALAGCSKEVREQRVQPADSSSVHALSVEIESGAYQDAGGETKASMEAVIRVKWKKDDEVSVVNATTGKLLGGCLKAEEDGESVVFEGTVTGTIEPSNRLYYIYPRVEDNTEEKAFADYNISLANQKYDGNKISDVCFYGYAEELAGSGSQNESTNISRKIKFNLVTSYVHLNMANLPVNGTSLSCIDISNVNEGFTWKLSEEKTLSATPYVGNKAISVKCSNADITPSCNAVARFAIPASAKTDDDRVVTVNNAYTNNMYTKLELPAASYYNQLYTTWTENKAEVNTTEDPNKTKVTINNNNSKDVAEGAIPTEAFGTTGQDSKPTEISIGGMGTITFDKDATSRILENASGSTSVLFKVEDVTTTKPVKNADIVYEVTMKTLDEHGNDVFPDVKDSGKTPGRATVSIPLEDYVAYVHTITLVDSDGNPIGGGVIPESIDLTNHILSFDVEHFSKYAVGYVTEKDFVSVTGVALDESSVTLAVEETKTLTATVAPEEATNKKVKWSSSDEAVATVDKDGKVTAVAAGTATITVTTEDESKTATCTVTVVVPVTGVSLNKTALTLEVSSDETLTATVAPDDATNKNVTWSSDKTDIATVDKDGKVTAVAAGTATITVTTEDGNYKATCTVTVVVPVTGVSLNKTALTLEVGSDETLTATVNPTNATNKNVNWSSSNEAVATVEGGKVTAVAHGTATITVTTEDGSKTATCALTVTTGAGFNDYGDGGNI